MLPQRQNTGPASTRWQTLGDEQMDKVDVLVPLSFWLDHADRCPSDRGQEGIATLVREVGSRALIQGDRDQLAELYADAEFYADPESMDECPRYLRDSAKRTVDALRKAGLA